MKQDKESRIGKKGPTKGRGGNGGVKNACACMLNVSTWGGKKNGSEDEKWPGER